MKFKLCECGKPCEVRRGGYWMCQRCADIDGNLELYHKRDTTIPAWQAHLERNRQYIEPFKFHYSF